MRVALADLGRWSGARLLAEYDPEADTIRIDARSVERVRSVLGAAAAECFLAYALAHERFHRAHPDAGEAAAHDAAERATGVTRERFEAVLRA